MYWVHVFWSENVHHSNGVLHNLFAGVKFIFFSRCETIRLGKDGKVPFLLAYSPARGGTTLHPWCNISCATPRNMLIRLTL